MARINTNVSSIVAQKNLGRAYEELDVRLQRLATGLRINRGADDPAGLIVSERLRSEIAGIDQGIKNSERASSVISTTEAALAEVSDLLNSIKALVVEAANTGAVSREEISANQLQIDSAIESITRIANTSSFAGLKLLDGSLAYRTSGINESEIIKAQIFGADFGDNASVGVDVEVVGSAQQGMMFLRSDFSAGGGTDGLIPSSVTLEIAGPDGVDVITFISGTSIDDIVDAVNSRASVTGVRAERVSATDDSSGIVFNSVAYGSESFVTVNRLSGGSGLEFVKLNDGLSPPIDWSATATYSAAENDAGQDVSVLINGSLATGRGLQVTLRTTSLDAKFLLDEAFATTVDGAASSFTITGGGALYQLGPQVTALQQVNVGVDSVAASRLGGTYNTLGDGSQALQFLSSLKSGGDNDLLNGNLANASKVLETAIDEISTFRGRLGAFERNVLATNQRSLQTALENITASDSMIRDADFAEESSQLTRAQILTQAGTSVLALANTTAQNVLQLLG